MFAPIIAWITGKVGATGLKIIGVLLLAGAIGYTIWLGFHYVDGLSQQVATLSADNASLKIAVSSEKAANYEIRAQVAKVAADAAINNQRLGDVAAAATAARADAAKLSTTLAKHDLGRLLNAKPTLMESHINAASDRMRGLLVDASRIAGDGDAPGTAPSGSASDAASARPDQLAAGTLEGHQPGTGRAAHGGAVPW